MEANQFLGRDIDLWSLAERTKNFSGAELEGLVKSAASFALNRQVDVNDLSKPIDEDNIKVIGVFYLGISFLEKRHPLNKGDLECVTHVHFFVASLQVGVWIPAQSPA